MSEDDRAGGVGLAEHPSETPPVASGIQVRVGIGIAVLLVVAALVGVTLTGGLSDAPQDAPAVAPAAALPPADLPSAAPVDPSAPLRVRVPTIGADSSLVPVGLDAQNRIDVPPVSQPQQAAWYDRGPAPGAVGPAVVLGHVNGNGRRGVFADLSRVQPGQQVEIDRADGRTAVFTVYHVSTESKTSFPTAQVYGNTPDAQIRLITCGGRLDETEHSYLSNVIVFGSLTAVRPT